jgi:glycosyltransferase involved in cell wall biosynthesis
VKEWLGLIRDMAYFALNFFGRQREFVLKSNQMIAVSKAVKQALIDETFVPEEKVTVVYNGMNLHTEHFPEEEKNIDVLYVGQVTEAKGLRDLAKALATKNVKVGIIGDGEFLDELKELAPSFEYFGRLEQDKLHQIMNRSSIFVLPSRRWEGMPMTLIEAAMMGLPCVGSDLGGIPEVIEDGKTGFVYTAGNIPQLQERISRLLADEDLRLELGQNARQRAHEKFSLDKMLDGYEKVLMGVLK